MKKMLCFMLFLPLLASAQNVLDSDCPTTSYVLKDKSTKTLLAGASAGAIVDEADGAPCFSGSGSTSNIEAKSTWFKWVCDKAGSLTFLLTPEDSLTDIDFVLYETNNINSCSNRSILRCMASGESFGVCALLGQTGLTNWSLDISEPSGCKPGQDNFLKQLDMEEGKTYALMVNNFTGTKKMFTIEFGGTGTFKSTPLRSYEAESLLSFSLYPSPSNIPAFTIDFENIENQPNQIEVLDALGRIVFTKENISSNNLIDLEGKVTEGIYFVKLKLGTNSLHKKWVFQR